MAGLVPAIHVLIAYAFKTWMPATSAGMTFIERHASSLRAQRDRYRLDRDAQGR